MRRLIIAVLVAISMLSVGATVATGVAHARVAGHYRSATDSAASFPDFRLTADHEQVVDLQAWDTAGLYALKAANPHVKVLMYQNASAVSSTASSSGIYATGVSYDQAAANGWLLVNMSGSTFTFGGYSGLWAADVGSRAYQDAWVSNVIGKLKSAPWDGVMIDDVNPTIRYHYCVTCVAAYPSDAQYANAMKSFVEDVGTRIQDAGELAVANIGSWPGYASVVDPWLQHLNGAEDEMFLKWSARPGTGYADPGTWASQLDEVKLAASEGKMFIGITHSANTDERAAVYGYATELLAGAGQTVFYMGSDYTNETWFPEYDYALGDPTGVESVEANGVHRRLFATGLVLVNPTTSARTVSLGGTYSGSGLQGATSVSMAPQTGLVLVGNAGGPRTDRARRCQRSHLSNTRRRRRNGRRLHNIRCRR